MFTRSIAIILQARVKFKSDFSFIIERHWFIINKH